MLVLLQQILVGLCFLAVAQAFVTPAGGAWCRVVAQGRVASSSSSLSMKWDGKSQPKKSDALKKLMADASWDRSSDRVDVWEDKPNPKFNWWEAYLPTEEEQEAAAAGYDFANPEAWLAKATGKAVQK